VSQHPFGFVERLVLRQSEAETVTVWRKDLIALLNYADRLENRLEALGEALKVIDAERDIALHEERGE